MKREKLKYVFVVSRFICRVVSGKIAPMAIKT
jgi:hypothetical protein